MSARQNAPQPPSLAGMRDSSAVLTGAQILLFGRQFASDRRLHLIDVIDVDVPVGPDSGQKSKSNYR